MASCLGLDRPWHGQGFWVAQVVGADAQLKCLGSCDPGLAEAATPAVDGHGKCCYLFDHVAMVHMVTMVFVPIKGGPTPYFVLLLANLYRISQRRNLGP